VATVGGTIKTLIGPEVWFFVVGVPIVVLAYLWTRSTRARQAVLSGRAKWITLILLILVAFSAYGYVLLREKQQAGDIQGLYARVFNVQELVQKLGIINYSLEDMIMLALTNNHISAADHARVAAWAKQHQPIAPGPKFGLAKGRNLIMIQVESLQNFTINRRISGQEITPNLNRLLGQGLYFPNYYYQSGPGTTADAEFSVTNSLYPLTDGVVFFNEPHDHFEALPSLLKDHGYDTAVMHGDVPSFWNRNNVYPGLGYQQILSNQDFTMTRYINLGLSRAQGIGDAEFLSQAADKLTGLPQPFATTLITLSSHTPFEIPHDLWGLNITAPAGLNDMQIKYLETIHYADQALGEFITKLKASGLYDDSLIVIYGDHQSFSFNQTDPGFAHLLGASQLDPLTYLQNNQVPLLVLAPGLNLTGTAPQPASHLDLYPTLADLLGFAPPRSVLGQDLLATDHPVVTQRFNGAIADIVTPGLIYLDSGDGQFAHGKCLGSDGTVVSLGRCRDLYNQQSQTVQVSDIAVKGDLIKLLESQE